LPLWNIIFALKDQLNLGRGILKINLGRGILKINLGRGILFLL
jgi:hypothetical protein